MKCIRLCKGCSRDQHPDLNQTILLLLSENQSGIPLFMQTVSGNKNDNKSFNQVVKQHISSFKRAVSCRYLVGDSALYTEDGIQNIDKQNQYFISRAPVRINQAV